MIIKQGDSLYDTTGHIVEIQNNTGYDLVLREYNPGSQITLENFGTVEEARVKFARIEDYLTRGKRFMVYE